MAAQSGCSQRINRQIKADRCHDGRQRIAAKKVVWQRWTIRQVRSGCSSRPERRTPLHTTILDAGRSALLCSAQALFTIHQHQGCISRTSILKDV